MKCKCVKNKPRTIDDFIKKDHKSFIDLYQFELQGYPESTKKSTQFYDIEFSENDDCGIIESEHSRNNVYHKKRSSCDFIKSPKKTHTQNTNKRNNNVLENISSNKENDKKNPTNKFNINDFYDFYLQYSAKNNKVLTESRGVWKQKYNECLIEIIQATTTNVMYINKHSDPNNINIKEFDNQEYSTKKHEEGMLFNIKTNNKEKIVVFGDLHGSFHTFLRNIFRLYKLKIIKDLETFKLRSGCKIIFLGDIVDRGFYGMEVLMIILKLMNANNTKDELKVICNRGNHEEKGLYEEHGFLKEIKTKLSKKKYETFINYLFHFFTYLSSALILTNIDTKNNYWLSHGGIPISKTNVYKLKKFTKNVTVINYDKIAANQFRWNDFYNGNKNICNESRNCECATDFSGCFVVSQKYARNFMAENDIQFIIRAHQDSTANFYLVSSLNNDDGGNALIMDDIIDMNENEIIHMNANKYNDKNRNAFHGPISRINIDSKQWKISTIKSKVSGINNQQENIRLYPIITISTNTDFGRKLVHDSFGIIRFDISDPKAFKKR